MLRRTLSLGTRLFSQPSSRFISSSPSQLRLRGWIFDTDGTTAGKHGELVKFAFQHLFKQKKMTLPMDLMLKGMGSRKDQHILDMMTELHPEWRQQYPEKDPAKLKILFQQDAADIYAGFNKLILGIMRNEIPLEHQGKYIPSCKPIQSKIDVIKKLQKSGMKIGHVSGFPFVILAEVLKAHLALGIDTRVAIASDHEKVPQGRPAPFLPFAAMTADHFACENPLEVVLVDDMLEGVRSGKNLKQIYGQSCWTVLDLSHSCFLNPQTRDEPDDSLNLQAQRESLIQQYILSGTIQPDYVTTSAEDYLTVNADISSRLQDRQKPGDMPTRIIRHGQMEELNHARSLLI